VKFELLVRYRDSPAGHASEEFEESYVVEAGSASEALAIVQERFAGLERRTAVAGFRVLSSIEVLFCGHDRPRTPGWEIGREPDLEGPSRSWNSVVPDTVVELPPDEVDPAG